MENTNLDDSEKLRYLQIKIHEATLECVNTYFLFREGNSLFHTFLSLVFMRFRGSVDTSISTPYRSKALNSIIDNIEKEILKRLTNQLPPDYTTSDIDTLIQDVVENVCKDFLAATIVFHSKNNLSNYCKESDDIYVKTLYKQVLNVEEFLRSSEKSNNSSLWSKIYSHFKTIDISNTFIDDNPNPMSPTKLKPLNLKNINTLEDYYTQLIGLLTLLTNCSLPCTESTDGKVHKYCVSELDIPYLQLVKQAKEQNPKNKDEFIRILTDLAHKSYYREYTPFDEQLEKALIEQENAKKSHSYKSQLSNKDKKKYAQELNNLKNNLQKMKNDRLLNYVLKIELPNIFSKLSELPNLHVEVQSSKERAKSDGFYACFYTLIINGIIVCEVQGHSEFRSILTKEGNAAHNLLPGKLFDIKHLFELRAFPFDNNAKAEELLNFYCDFLDSVNLNDVSGYHTSKEDIEALRDLQDLVNYATSKIKVKDFITVKNGDNITYVPFYDYISGIISANGAEYGTIYPAHIVEHNQSLSVPQNKLYTLENLLKSRVGFSTLANLVREKYKKCSSIEKNEHILSKYPPQTYSSTLTPEYDLPIDNNIIKTAKENYEPLDIPFYPMGSFPKHNQSKEEKDSSTSR